jgi:cell wall-associated NlpC family hydrolase
MSRRIVAASLALATTVGLLVTGNELAAATPKPPGPAPTNPSNGQISAAQSAKNAVATEVGQLTGQIAEAENELTVLQGKAEQAEQKAAYAQSQLQLAQQQAHAATAALHKAQQDVDAAHAAFVRYVQAMYMSGDVDGAAGTLLTADDPSALLEQSSLEQFQAQHHADAVGRLETATVARSNAEARAKSAVEKQKVATAQAKAAQQAAFAAVASARQREAALNADLNTKRAELLAKQQQLATLNNQRAAWDAWYAQKKAYDAEQARLRAERERRAREAAERARRARERQQQQHGGGGGGSSSGGGWSSGPSAPSGGSWTAAKGRAAVRRAESQLGVPYAWAGGGVDGASWGVCDSSNGAPNDCNVRGFDCSGLVLFAWGRYWAHYAATQYTQAGSYHPSLGNLRPGDLLFWSYDGTIGGIHHVAIYIGGGEIIQAPESGDVVRISSMYDPGPIFGATRPLT